MENSQFFLSHYANNQKQQSLFYESARAANERHAKLSDITELRHAIDSMVAPTFDDMFPYFERILSSDSIRQVFQTEAECSLLSDIYQAQGQSIENDVMSGLQFIDGEHFAVATVVTDPTSIAYKKIHNADKATSVMMSPKNLLLRFIRAGGARITVYSCDPITDDTPATSETSCRKIRTYRVEDGDMLVLRAGQDSFTFEYADSAVCFAQAYAKYSPMSVMPEFDSKTMRLIGLSATNDKSSRIQMMTTILRIFKHADAFEVMKPFIEHEDYFVRWYVMRELLSIDHKRAWPLVERMATYDPHPHVRQTAAKTLDLLSDSRYVTN